VNEEQHRLNSERILYISYAQTQQDFSESTKRRTAQTKFRQDPIYSLCTNTTGLL
jgi:hypothetical protein